MLILNASVVLLQCIKYFIMLNEQGCIQIPQYDSAPYQK